MNSSLNNSTQILHNARDAIIGTIRTAGAITSTCLEMVQVLHISRSLKNLDVRLLTIPADRPVHQMMNLLILDPTELVTAHPKEERRANKIPKRKTMKKMAKTKMRKTPKWT